MSGENRILDAAMEAALSCLDPADRDDKRAMDGARIVVDAVAEVFRAALATAEAERDTWKAYAARVAQEARDGFGAFEAAVERVGVLEAAAEAARAVLAVPEGDSPE